MKKVIYNGIEYSSARKFCDEKGIAYSTFLSYRHQGLSVDKAYERCAIVKTKKEIKKEKEHEITERINQQKQTKSISHGNDYYKNDAYINYNDRYINNPLAMLPPKETVEAEVVEEVRPTEFELVDVKRDTNRVHNKIVSTVSETVDEIKKYGICNVNLIDFENINNQDRLSDLLEDENAINIYFFNASILSNKYYNIIKESKSINFQVLTFRAADQLVDHMIVYYLGGLSTLLPDLNYTIISNDTGYLSFVDDLNSSHITMKSVSSSTVYNTILLDKDTKFKYAIASYIMKNHNIKDGSCLTKTDFSSTFNSFFKYGNRTNCYKNIEVLIDKLIDYNFIQENKTTYGTHYIFDLSIVQDTLNELNNR